MTDYPEFNYALDLPGGDPIGWIQIGEILYLAVPIGKEDPPIGLFIDARLTTTLAATYQGELRNWLVVAWDKELDGLIRDLTDLLISLRFSRPRMLQLLLGLDPELEARLPEARGS